MTLAETIHRISLAHIAAGGLILGQNLEAVQNVCGTVPVGEPGVTIMPTTETAGIGISIGAALSGRPVIHVIRFASFLWLQSSPIVNYLAKAKEIWGYEIPLWIRVSSDDNIGPVHSGIYHSPFLHMPGNLQVVAPMTPKEYLHAWADFQQTKRPYLVSEHRASYGNTDEMWNSPPSRSPDVTLIAIGPSRFEAIKAQSKLHSAYGKIVNIFHIWNLSDIARNQAPSLIEQSVASSRAGCLIIDSTYERCSFAEHLAFTLYKNLAKAGLSTPIEVLGLAPLSPGVSINRNATPSCDIIVDAALALWR